MYVIYAISQRIILYRVQTEEWLKRMYVHRIAIRMSETGNIRHRRGGVMLERLVCQDWSLPSIANCIFIENAS